MLSVTPTKLADYLICPHKFKRKHVDKSAAFAASPAFSFGSSMHRALQELHNPERAAFSSNGAAEPLLRRFWEPAAYQTPQEEQSYFIKGCAALENYRDAMAANFDEETLGTEVYLSFVVDLKNTRVRLGCKVDRLAFQPAENVLEIIDYKTNASGKVPVLDFLQTDLPTFLYYVLTRISYPQYPNIRITFLNVLTLARVSVQYDKQQIDKNKQALWQTLKTLASEVFAPRRCEACAWCDFQDECAATNKVVDFTQIF